MKVNSPEALVMAGKIFRSYGNSWLAVRAAGRRDADGVLHVPWGPHSPDDAVTLVAATAAPVNGEAD